MPAWRKKSKSSPSAERAKLARRCDGDLIERMHADLRTGEAVEFGQPAEMIGMTMGDDDPADVA